MERSWLGMSPATRRYAARLGEVCGTNMSMANDPRLAASVLADHFGVVYGVALRLVRYAIRGMGARDVGELARRAWEAVDFEAGRDLGPLEIEVARRAALAKEIGWRRAYRGERRAA